MTLQVAKDAIDFIHKNILWKRANVDPTEKSSITFFGGEPVLMWDQIIVPLTLYIEETYPDMFNFSITTNGTLLNAEKIQFLKDHDIGVLLSIDGAEETQNFNRPCRDQSVNSFDLVVNNIPRLLQAFPYTTFRSTVYEPTCQYIFKNFLFAMATNFTNIFMMPDTRNTNWSAESFDIIKNEIHKIFMFTQQWFEMDKMPPIILSDITNVYKEILDRDVHVIKQDPFTNDGTFSRDPQRCGLGTGMGSIGYNGNIYGCQEQTSKETLSKFFIGNIYTGIDIEKHSELLREYSAPVKVQCQNPSMCDDCLQKNYCNSICPSACWDVFQNFNTTNYMQCFWDKCCYAEAQAMMQTLVKANNQTFKAYLDDVCKYKYVFESEVEV